MATLRYITLNELVNEIPDAVQGLLTNDTANTNTKVNSIVEQKALAAEQLFESAIAVRYDIPVKFTDGTVPEQVKQCIYSLAKYLLYARRNKITAEIQAQYDTWMGWLNKVAAGKMSIPILNANDVVDSTGDEPTVEVGTSYPQQFRSFV